jgi:hypothetical protein
LLDGRLAGYQGLEHQAMTTIYEILRSLPEHTLLSDGATTWDPSNLQDALRGGDDDGALETASYALGATTDGRITISRVGDDGYLISPPDYVEPATAERCDDLSDDDLVCWRPADGRGGMCKMTRVSREEIDGKGDDSGDAWELLWIDDGNVRRLEIRLDHCYGRMDDVDDREMDEAKWLMAYAPKEAREIVDRQVAAAGGRAQKRWER